MTSAFSKDNQSFCIFQMLRNQHNEFIMHLVCIFMIQTLFVNNLIGDPINLRFYCRRDFLQQRLIIYKWHPIYIKTIMECSVVSFNQKNTFINYKIITESQIFHMTPREQKTSMYQINKYRYTLGRWLAQSVIRHAKTGISLALGMSHRFSVMNCKCRKLDSWQNILTVDVALLKKPNDLAMKLTYTNIKMILSMN